MNIAAPIKDIVVAGGGIVAWSAAAALKRRIPSLDVTVVSCPVPPDALADRMTSTLPSIAVFHRDLGLTDEDTIVRARSGLRLGTLFEGWVERHARPMSTLMAATARADRRRSFHQLWLRARADGSSWRSSTDTRRRRKLARWPDRAAEPTDEPQAGDRLRAAADAATATMADDARLCASSRRRDERPCRIVGRRSCAARTASSSSWCWTMAAWSPPTCSSIAPARPRHSAAR